MKCEWRTDRDSNPGYPFGVYSLSRGALSTTQPSVLDGVAVDNARSRNISECFRQVVKAFEMKIIKLADCGMIIVGDV